MSAAACARAHGSHGERPDTDAVAGRSGAWRPAQAGGVNGGRSNRRGIGGACDINKARWVSGTEPRAIAGRFVSLRSRADFFQDATDGKFRAVEQHGDGTGAGRDNDYPRYGEKEAGKDRQKSKCKTGQDQHDA